MSSSKVQPGERIIHVIPQTFEVDGVADIQEEDVVGMVGSDVKVYFNIITADAGAMSNIQRSVEMAGLDLRGFILEPLVSAEAVLDDNDKEAGVVLVDIGGGTTDVAIFKNSILCHTAVIPLAGNAITSDIRIGCNILPKQAESLKVKFGSALPSENSDEQIVSIPGLKGRPAKEISLKQLAGIIGARVEEIFSSVACEQVVKDDPEAKVAYLSGDKSPAELHEKGYTGIDYHQNVITSHPEWVEEAHRLGMTVNAWTVNGTEDMMKLCSMGVDLITTDNPVAASLLEKYLEDNK